MVTGGGQGQQFYIHCIITPEKNSMEWKNLPHANLPLMDYNIYKEASTL